MAEVVVVGMVWWRSCCGGEGGGSGRGGHGGLVTFISLVVPKLDNCILVRLHLDLLK